jgi:carbamoyltransferase
MGMKVLGINLAKNGSIAIINNGELEFYLEEERVTRKKRDVGAYALCEKYVDDTIDVAVYSDCFTKYNINYNLEKRSYKKKLDQLLYSKGVKKILDFSTRHHECHAASAFYGSGFDDAVCVVMDGKGSVLKKNSISFCEIESIYNVVDGEFIPLFKHYSCFYNRSLCEKVEEPFWDGINLFSNRVSLGQAFRCVSAYCGFDELEAGKTMGLSAYGSGVVNLFNEECGHSFCSKDIHPRDDNGWTKYYGKETAKEDLAYNLQKSAENHTLYMIKKAVELSGKKNVVVSGGFFLNCVSNYNVLKSLDINLYADPLSYDGGHAFGSAMLVSDKKTSMKTLYLGPSYDLSHIEGLDTTYDQVASLISNKNIVAIFQGRSEAGPRALGNRSILYDPRDPNGKDHVNTIKRREAFRPFAGTILKEYANQWFDMAGLEESPFMMYAVDAYIETAPFIPAILHVDKTCRIQTVTKEQNEHYYNLISAFYEKTNVPILFNTSFNLAGEPLVETPEDALRTFHNSDIKYLYFPEVQKLIVK